MKFRNNAKKLITWFVIVLFLFTAANPGITVPSAAEIAEAVGTITSGDDEAIVISDDEAAAAGEEADVVILDDVSAPLASPSDAAAEAQTAEDLAIAAEGAVLPLEAPAAAPRAPHTGAYASFINLVSAENKFFGGETITIYNNISVSGNQTVLEEGSYTVISIPKATFERPLAQNISTAFDNFLNLQITDTADSYKITTSYKKLYGGYTGGSPIKVNLIPRQTVNESEHLITQEFFDKDGNMLTDTSTLQVFGKAKIEVPYNNYAHPERLPNASLDTYVVKPNTYRQFYMNYNGVTHNQNDPRDRRVYATIPQGTTVKPDTGWTLEPATNRYYKDIPRDSMSTPVIELDLGGIDMNAHDENTSAKLKRIQVDFTIQPVVGGVPQTDLGPHQSNYYRNFYILKTEPVPPAVTASQSLATFVYNKTIDRSYQPVSGGVNPVGSWRHSGGYFSDRNLTYLSYSLPLLNTQRIRYTHNILSSYTVSNPRTGDEATRELSVVSSEMTVSPYVSPAELRLMIVGLSDEDTTALTAMLQGTKAYGYKGTEKVLITDNVPVVSYDRYQSSHTNEGWQAFNGGNEYSKIEFEYPDTLKFVSKAQIDKFYSHIWPDVVGDIRESAHTLLANNLNNGTSPVINFQADNAITKVKAKFIVADNEAPREVNATTSDSTRDEFRMQYEDIVNHTNVHITSGSHFLTNDTIATSLTYNHNRFGNFSNASMPANPHIYYLVPDGLEPVDNPAVFDSIEVIRGYADGKNLVVAKPKVTNIPSIDAANSLNGNVTNTYALNFIATNRLEIGSYNIYACLSIDNNRIGVDENGQQYGILQRNIPGGVWANILNDARNRPDNRNSYTDFSNASFTLYPPRVLSSNKQIKLSSEPDSKYASSLGSKATIGSAIDYRWRFKNNSPSEINSLMVIDILPYNGDKSIVPNEHGAYTDRGSKFKTPLISVDDVNGKFDIFYSTDAVKPTLAENVNANWSAAAADMSAVTMIKAVLKTGAKIGIDESVAIVTHNTIENDSRLQDGDKAYNSFAISLNSGNSFIEALRVEAQVTYPKSDVNIEKYDAGNPDKKLYNAIFSLYEDVNPNGEGVLLRENITTNRLGIAAIPDLFVGKKYYIVETAPPQYYERNDSKIRFTVEDRGAGNPPQVIQVPNDMEKTSVSVTKVWVGEPAGQVNIQLKADGAVKQDVILRADTGWTKTFDNLPKYDETDKHEIVYTVSEAPVEGYDGAVSGDAAAGFTITNTKRHIPLPVNVPLSANKLLDNAPAAGTEFRFVLRDSNGAVIQTKNNNNGAVVFDPLEFSQAGTYRYTIEEIAGTNQQIIYDDTVYGVIINVTLAADYEATVSYLKDNAAFAGNVEFKNKTKETPPGGGQNPPPSGGQNPPPSGGQNPPPSGGQNPPPNGGQNPPPNGGQNPPPNGGQNPPPNGGQNPPPSGSGNPPIPHFNDGGNGGGNSGNGGGGNGGGGRIIPGSKASTPKPDPNPGPGTAPNPEPDSPNPGLKPGPGTVPNPSTEETVPPLTQISGGEADNKSNALTGSLVPSGNLPKTGDSTRSPIWLIMSLVFVLELSFVFAFMRRFRRNK